MGKNKDPEHHNFCEVVASKEKRKSQQRTIEKKKILLTHLDKRARGATYFHAKINAWKHLDLRSILMTKTIRVIYTIWIWPIHFSGYKRKMLLWTYHGKPMRYQFSLAISWRKRQIIKLTSNLYGIDSKKIEVALIFLVNVENPCVRWPPSGRCRPIRRSWGFRRPV